MKRLMLLSLFVLAACSTYHSIYPPTPRQYCKDTYWYDEYRKDKCIAEHEKATVELISKLHYYGVTDEYGNLLQEGRNKTEYRIFHWCEAKWRSLYSAANRCFDYVMKENERRGTWGINTPDMWWWRNTYVPTVCYSIVNRKSKWKSKLSNPLISCHNWKFIKLQISNLNCKYRGKIIFQISFSDLRSDLC